MRQHPTMRRTMAIFAVLMVCQLDGIASPASAHEFQQLDSLLRTVRSGRNYVPATPQELERCEELFYVTLQDPQRAALPAEWRRMGFELRLLAGTQPQQWVIFEPPLHKRGWGCYVICPARLPGVVLQAPHSYSDRYTGNVALRLYTDGTCGAAAWNTTTRKIVDVAHVPEHPFSAFTRAMVRLHTQTRIVQIHGFSPNRRETDAGEASDLILSNGTHAPDRLLRQLTVMLQNDLGFAQVHLFPTDVQELGATTNAQCKILQEIGRGTFVHLEMSLDLRLRLVTDSSTRQVLLKNLSDCVD